MQAPSLNPEPKTDKLAHSFSRALKKFGIQFQHTPDYKLIWIPVDEISVDLQKYPSIYGMQGETKIVITRYSKAISVYLANLYEKKLIQLPPDIAIEYHNGDIVVDF